MFHPSGLYLTRGTYNTAAGGPDNGTEALNTTQHFYKSNTDTLAVITLPGYFPNTLGSSIINSQGFMSINDFILIEGSDASALFQIQLLNPFTLSSSSLVPITTTYVTQLAGGVPSNLTQPITFNITKIGTLVTISLAFYDVGVTTGPAPFAFYGNVAPFPLSLTSFLPPPGQIASGWLKVSQISPSSQFIGELVIDASPGPLGNIFQLYASATRTINYAIGQDTTLGPGFVSYSTV